MRTYSRFNAAVVYLSLTGVFRKTMDPDAMVGSDPKRDLPTIKRLG